MRVCGRLRGFAHPTCAFLNCKAEGKMAMSLTLPCKPILPRLGVFEEISCRTFFLLGVIIASIVHSVQRCN